MTVCISTIILACVITVIIYYRPYLGIAFVIVSIPFEGRIGLDYFAIYPLEIILIILAFICILKLVMRRENYFKNTSLVYCYLPFMICILLSALKFMELSLTVKEVVRWLEIILVYYLTINLVNDYKRVRVILYSIILTVGMVSIWGIINYVNDVMTVEEVHRATAFSGCPNALACYVSLIMPALFGMVLTNSLLWEKFVLGFFLVLCIVTWFLSFSKAAYIALLMTMILLFFLTKVKKQVAICMVTLIVSFAIVALFTNIKSDIADRFLYMSHSFFYKNRIENYSIGLRMISDDLFFGIGVSNYPLLIGEFTKRAVVIQTNLHNLYFQIFVEAGLTGLCSFIFWFTGIIKYLIRFLKLLEGSEHYGLFIGLVGGIIVYLINNITNVSTVHGIHLQWGIILGLAVVLTQFRESETCPKTV